MAGHTVIQPIAFRNAMTRQPLTIRRVRRLLDTGKVSSEQICSYCHSLAVAGEEVWRLNAFTHLIARDQLLEWARQSDQHRRKQYYSHGKAPTSSSPLFEGFPVSIKANLAVANMPLTAASRILGGGMANAPDVGYDADVVKILLRDGGGGGGAILMGITNMDEFGMGSLGTTGIGGYTRNPTRYLRRLRAIQKSSLLLPHPHSDSLGDNEWVALIHKSHDEILEMHQRAYKEEEEEEGIVVHSTGGSSCGSAASVAHGSSLLSLGTDTGGSVRLPAAWCGVVGLKPSYGLLSRHGVVSYASSLDTVGILAPTVDCATTALDALAQRHGPSRDSTASFYPQSLSLTKSIYQEEVRHEQSKLSGIKVGIPAALSVKECPASVQEVWAKAATFLQLEGAVVEIVSNEILSPNIVQKSLAAYYVVASAEASSNLSRYDGFRYGILKHPSSSNMSSSHNPSTATAPITCSNHGIPPLEQQYGATRIQGFGTEVTRRILCGTSVLSSDRFHTHYEAAARLRALLCQQLSHALTHVDVLLFPTTLFSPCRLDDKNCPPDNTEMLANDVMTVPASLAGLPAVSVPLPQLQSSLSLSTTNDVVFPPSIQLVGSRLGEATLLRVARVFEEGDRKFGTRNMTRESYNTVE